MNAEGKEQKIIHFNGDGSVKAFPQQWFDSRRYT